MDEMRTALRTLEFLLPSWGRLSRPLSDISLIWSAQDPRPMGMGMSRRGSPIPAQLPPRTRPPSALLLPATPSAVLPPPLSPRDGKGEGGTTVGTVGTVSVPPRPLRLLLHLFTLLFLLPLDCAVTGQPPQCSGSGKEFWLLGSSLCPRSASVLSCYSGVPSDSAKAFKEKYVI
ncbi:unnamed protein product [Pleuronectes platessa]|uniref:Uncharacterized protein n=1 Tax=Pleuronectes platessa TaxID=8262 RepID=A0A9N7UME9_PLEPL|nr:unnamed protein product [Pleuronectes platessa]